MTTAAEALEKLIRLERDLEKKCHDLGYYNMIHVGLREFVEHAAAFRAALAQPQEGEVEPRKVMQTEFGVDGNCQSACIATITGIPLDAIPNFTKLGKTDLQRRQAMCEWLWAHGWGIVTFVASDTEIRRWYPGFVIAGGESARGIYHGVVYKDGELWHDPHPDGTGLTKVEDCDILYRLLRATQSTQPAAPVQEPVRYTMWSTSDGYVNPRADPEGAWVLYAAPQPAQADEARELLREVMNELIVDPEASWPDIQRGEKLQERIDAYLVRTGGKEEK